MTTYIPKTIKEISEQYQKDKRPVKVPDILPRLKFVGFPASTFIKANSMAMEEKVIEIPLPPTIFIYILSKNVNYHFFKI